MRLRDRYTNTLFGYQYSSNAAPFAMSGPTAYLREEHWEGTKGNYGYPDFPANRAVGGGFGLNKTEWSSGLVDVGEIYGGGPNNYSFKGRMAVAIDPLGFVNTHYPPDSWGALAYNRMKPTAPDFNMGNFVYELRELPRQIMQRFLSSGLASIGNYWLAYQFGWKLLLQDIVKMYVLQQNLEKRLKQLLRDNGRPVRRRVTLYDTATLDSVVTQSNIVATFVPTLVSQYYSGPYGRTVKYSSFDRVWASARFRYWLPEGPRDIRWTRNMKAAIFGAFPSPSVVWNALPWTWLIDWFAGVGNILENMETGVADRLAADYFYVMREKGGRSDWDATIGFRRKTGERVVFTGSAYSQWTAKSRTIGDPFGFNTQLPLSGMQLSILGALGLSKIR